MKLLLIATLLYTTGLTQANPEVSILPTTDVPLQPGSLFTLVCRVSNFTTGMNIMFEVNWTGPDGSTMETMTVTMDTNGINNSVTTSLVFNTLKTSQAGNYSCMVNLTETNEIVVKTSTIRVKAPVPVVTLMWSREIPFYEGTSLSLLCIIQLNRTGIDTPFYLERKLSFRSDDRKEMTEYGTSDSTTLQLAIRPLALTDSETYVCNASFMPNSTSEFLFPSDRAEKTMNLSVSVLPPPAIAVSHNRLAVIGQWESLTCLVTVAEQLYAEPQIHWTNNRGEVLVNQAQSSTGTEFQLTLTFQELLASQTGEYSCFARIEIPSVDIYNHTASNSLHLIAQMPPLLMTLITDSVAYHGANHTLTCSFILDSSVDVPIHVEFQWFTSSSPDSPVSHDQSPLFEIHDTVNYSILKLTPTGQPSQANGTYRCNVRVFADFAEDVISAIGAATVDLIVQVPQPPTVSVQIIRSDSLCSAISSIECRGELEATLASSLEISWETPNKQRISNETINFNETTLELNAGLFTCMACISVNAVNLTGLCGSSSLPISVEAPKTVEDLTCHYTGETTSIGLTWKDPQQSNSSALEYIIEVQQYVRNGEFEDTMVITEQLTPPFKTATTGQLITGLEPAVRYVLLVTGVGAVGCGETQNLSCYTEQEAPQVVVHVVVDRISATSMNVTWIPLDTVEVRGFLFQYIVYYSKAGAVSQPNLNIKLVGPDQSNVLIDGLDAESNYRVQVIAQNAAGTSNLDQSPVASSGFYRDNSMMSSGDTNQDLAVSGGIIGAIEMAVVVVLIALAIVMAAYKFKAKRNASRNVYVDTINTPSSLPPMAAGHGSQFSFYSELSSSHPIPHHIRATLDVCSQYEDIEKFQQKPADYEVACPTLPPPRHEEDMNLEDNDQTENCLGYKNEQTLETHSQSSVD